MRTYKDEKSGRHYVDYFFAGRRIRYPAGDTKREADQLKSRITLEINAGTHNPERTKMEVKGRGEGSMTFEALVERFLAEYIPRSGRPNYYREQSRTWLRFFKGRRAAEIGRDDVEGMLRARLDEKVSPSTVRKDLVSLSTFFRWGKRNGSVYNNPADADSVRRPAEPFDPQEVRWLSDDELASLKSGSQPWLLNVIGWASETGMDKGTVTRLKWQELDLDRQGGRIARGRFAMQRDKTGKPVRQELSDGALEALNRATRVRHAAGFVFLNAEGQPIQARSLDWYLEKAYRDAKIVGCNFRTFRHTFATRALRRGVPREVLAKMMGHSTAFITERYMHVADDQLRAAALAMSGPERIHGSHVTVTPETPPLSEGQQGQHNSLNVLELRPTRRGTEVVATGPPRKRVGA